MNIPVSRIYIANIFQYTLYILNVCPEEGARRI